MKDKTISEMLDELKETIKKSADLLWEWEGCEGYCDLLKDLVPMVDEIKETKGHVKGYCRDCKYFMNNFVVEKLDNTDYEDVVCTYHMADGFTSNDYCSMFKSKNDNDAKIIYARFYEDTDKRKPNEKYIYYKSDGTEYIWKDDMWVQL